MLKIALDAMGGDNAPGMVLEAIQKACQIHPTTEFILFGDERLIGPQLSQMPSQLKKAVEFIPTTEVIGPDVKPSAAVRGYRNSSMYRAIKSVVDGQAQGVVSAGNTGAYMALSMLNFKTVASISRPAIATLIPTMKGASVMLDLGANVSCDAGNLVQFAVMGSVFAKFVLGLQKPSIGLLNIGSEDLKGHDVIKEAARILKEADNLNFVGFVEGDDIAKGTVDVIVTDGFTGNVALKTAEGVARMFATFMRQSFESSWLTKLGYLLARKPFLELKQRLDPRLHDGAIFIGLNHVAIKSHGGTDGVGFANAIGVAINTLQNQLNRHIVAELNRFTEMNDIIGVSS
ncbi:MAG: phosphate acyltransferase PlsX [Alphaproteobacteria bacterium]|nr:phosphate acyltransferase PlsX [Alphaproteobacteria bacterium]